MKLIEIANIIPTSSKYNAETADLYGWVVKIEKQLTDRDSDEFRELLDISMLVDQQRLFSTQSWLDYEHGGGDPVIEELDDRPVLVKKNEIYYILDGHHRCAIAYQAKRKISTYVFEIH